MTTEPETYLGLMPGTTAEQAIGLDIPRHWANAVQVTLAGDVCFLVFREQIGLVEENSERTAIRNIASVVMPRIVAQQLHEILTTQLAAVADESVGEDS